MTHLTIGEVAQQTGLTTSTLRYYEEIGVLPAPKRHNGIRQYDSKIVQQVKAIRAAQRVGYTLAEIKRLFYGYSDRATFSDRWKAMVPAKITELEARIAKTQQMKQMLEQGLHCQCQDIAECEMIASLSLIE